MDNNSKPTDFDVRNEQYLLKIDKIKSFIDDVLSIDSISNLDNYDDIIFNYDNIKNDIKIISKEISIESYIDDFHEKWDIVYDKLEMLSRAKKVKSKNNEVTQNEDKKQITEDELHELEALEEKQLQERKAHRQKTLKNVSDFYSGIFDLLIFLITQPFFWVLLICVIAGVVGGVNLDKVWGQYTLTSSIALFSIYINYLIGIWSDDLTAEWLHYLVTILIKTAYLTVAIIGLCNESMKACVLPFGIAIILTSILHTIMASEFEYGDDEFDAIIAFIFGGIGFIFVTIAISIILPGIVGTISAIVTAVLGIVFAIVYQLVFLDTWDDIFIWVGVIYAIIQILCGIIGAVAI